MHAAPAGTIAPHVEAATRLLRELDQHAHAAIDSLDRGDETGLGLALEKRDELLAELVRVTDAIARERASSGVFGHEAGHPLADLAAVADAAWASDKRLLERATTERNRLGDAVRRAGQRDVVAHQYAATMPAAQPILSVTG
jgi:hypothetical protein